MNIKLQTNEQLSVTVANGLAGVFINGVSLSANLSSKADLTALQNYYAKSETSSSSEISNELKKYQLSGNYLSSNALDNYYTKTETSSANQISTALANAGGGKVYFDNRISDITGSNDLSVVKLSADEYAQMLDDDTCVSNAIYIVEAPNIDAFKQQIKNVAPGTDLSDAVNVEQLSSIADNIEDQLCYSLTSALTSTSGTTQTVNLADHANNSATQGTGMTTVSLAFPTAISGKARDFILALTCGSTPPNVVFPVGVTIVVDDQTDLTTEEGLNLYSFTEISADEFVVSRLLVTAYSA